MTNFDMYKNISFTKNNKVICTLTEGNSQLILDLLIRLNADNWSGTIEEIHDQVLAGFESNLDNPEC